MLRRTILTRKVGDFITHLPNDNVYRSIFTLANLSGSGIDTANETEILARSIVMRAKDLASADSKVAGSFVPSHSRALVTSNILFTSPLFKLAGVPTATAEPETLFVWASSSSTSDAPILAWSGINESSQQSAKKIIAGVPTAEGEINFFEATKHQQQPSSSPSLAAGRIFVKLGKKIEIAAEKDQDAAAAAGGASMASSLVHAQLRLDHAAWVWSQIRDICKVCVNVGTNVKFQADRMSDAAVFHERVGAIAASEHTIFAAIQHTAMTLAESLTVANPALLNKTSETKAQTLAKDIDYDSGLLYLLSRNLLQSSIEQADKLLMRHGAAVSDFKDVVFTAGGEKEKWVVSAQNCDLVSGFDLASRLAGYVVTSGSSSSSSSSTNSKNDNTPAPKQQKQQQTEGNPIQQAINSLFKSKQAETFSDVHMNLTGSTAPIIKDFQETKKFATTTITPASAPILSFLAAELLGNTSLAYYTSNAVEIGESMGEAVKPGEYFAESECFAVNFASPNEASAVSWLALEVASEASKAKRSEYLKDVAALVSGTGQKVVSGLEKMSSTTHPMKLPRAPEQKQQQQGDEEMA